MATFQDIASTVRAKIPNVTRFKIGKTGQTVDERFRGEHEATYTSIEAIANATSKEAVNECEEYLIKEFMKHPKCDNKQIGGGDMGKCSRYYVYLVWR